MLEGCIELGLNGSVSIIMINKNRISNFSEFFSTLMAIFFCISLAIAPFYTLFAGYKLYKAKKERNNKVIDQLLPIFEGKDLKKALAIQYSNFFFVSLFLIVIFLGLRFTSLDFNSSTLFNVTSNAMYAELVLIREFFKALWTDVLRLFFNKCDIKVSIKILV